MDNLALFGGEPVIARTLEPYPSIGEAEIERVVSVMRSGCLSGFYGSPGNEFYGGPTVREFENSWRQHYHVEHAVSVNSATSGLYAAMGAIGISPGDEVIVPPYTMSATAMAPLIYGGIPVFADIEAETFCLDPNSVRSVLSEKTRAILAVNLFGHPAQLSELRKIADEKGLYLIEDNAQAPLASENGHACGTIGHIGVFSLNYHKHIHTGEGGVCVTNDTGLAQRLCMIRNHAENVVDWLEADNLTNLVGFNYRMTELQAAVGLAQLEGINRHVETREQTAKILSTEIKDLAGLSAPVVRSGCRHNYYMWAMRIDEEAIGIKRSTFSAALQKEGFPHEVGYVEPLYLLPMFQKRKAMGRDGFPFTLSDRRYTKGLCPVTERMHEKELLLFQPCSWRLEDKDAYLLAEAVKKVHAHLDALRSWERKNSTD